ncbi:MAG: hypothetical protein KDK99_05050 [Verrucomicrobiales bacterium]|nr:hypothetical protein [Verrucomicrobiales bacterium]
MISNETTRFHALIALFWLGSALSPLWGQDANVVQGRTILHPDDTRTETVRDPNTKTMETRTVDANGVLLARRLYQLNDQGYPVMGNIYDGAGTLQARCQSFFDAFGRLQEERLYNMAGECFQQLLHSYDADGKPQTPQVINYQVKSPTMRPAVIDFTQTQPDPSWGAPSSKNRAGGVHVREPVQGGAAPQGGGGMEPIQAPDPNAPKAEEEKKPGFFKRLFNRKSKD